MIDESKYAQVALNLALGRTLSYRIPDQLSAEIVVGCLVIVPFRRKSEIGCVVEIADDPGDVDPAKIRGIIKRASPQYGVSPHVLDLARFVSNYTLSSFGESLAAASIVGFNDVQFEAEPRWALVDDWRGKAAVSGATKRQKEVCERVADLPRVGRSKAELARAGNCSAGIIDRLVQAGLLVMKKSSAAIETEIDQSEAPVLNEEQETALKKVSAAISESRYEGFLLFGVTGSGKTEVYLRAMRQVLDSGGTVLCLIPEISLTPQTVARFEDRFGSVVGIFHSQQTRRQKLELHLRILRGEIKVVIGARSAVFVDLPKLGLIVVDEEHDSSYKQNETPCYNARDMALVRGAKLTVPVLLGSATPSLESWNNAASGKLARLDLKERATGVDLPPVKIVDLARDAQESDSPSLLGTELRAAITERLKRGEQTLLFLNRRGFSHFLFCPSCRWVARCDLDDVAMTVHHPNPGRSRGGEQALDLFRTAAPEEGFILRCHFCGKSEKAPTECPECKKPDLATIGAGTQRVEEELAELFPDANVMRLDHDSVGSRQKFNQAWEAITSGDVDVLLGTQMIAKGLHLERVTLVGIVMADVGLFLPDFRADERTFTLLTQVAGRSGRVGDGEVLMQTYMPHHRVIRFASSHDYVSFAESEIQRRKQMRFPPFSKLTALTVSDVDKKRAYDTAKQVRWVLGQHMSTPATRHVDVNGPVIAPLERLNDRWRYRVLVRGPKQAAVSQVIRGAMGDSAWKIPGSTRVSIDVDPLDLM